MSDYEEILKVSDDGKYRVKLIQDEYADEPYNDGQSPLMRIDYGRYGWTAEHIMATGRPTDSDDRIEEAVSRWGTDFALLEKYLRAFYGTTEIKTWHSGSYWYATYDTAEWREHVGAPPESANMDEYKAWCEGDCWGYVVEKNMLWRKDGDPDTTMESWEDVDSCWGFYGDYAREAALGAFDAEIAAGVPAEPEPQPKPEPTWAEKFWIDFRADFVAEFRRRLKGARRLKR